MAGGDEKCHRAFCAKYYNDILEYCWRHIRLPGRFGDAAPGNLCSAFLKNFLDMYQGKAKNYLYIIAEMYAKLLPDSGCFYQGRDCLG